MCALHFCTFSCLSISATLVLKCSVFSIILKSIPDLSISFYTTYIVDTSKISSSQSTLKKLEMAAVIRVNLADRVVDPHLESSSPPPQAILRLTDGR